MRIVNLTEFLALPENTLFSKYEPCIFGDLAIKGKSISESRDFLYQEIVSALDFADSGEYVERLFESEKMGASMSMDFDCLSRDGCFEEKQLFAVWEPEDVHGLITRLMACLPEGEP